MQGQRNAIDHTKVLTTKEEVKPEDHAVIERDRPDLINGIHLVSCPWKDFDVATTEECSKCVWWTGFRAANMKRPLAPGNAWSVCAFPMGRRVQTIKTEDK